MKVRIKNIGAEGYRLHEPLGRPFFVHALGADMVVGDEPEGSATLTLTRTGARVFVRGRVRARFQVPCGRCLDPAALATDVQVLATYLPKGATAAAPLPDLDLGQEEPDVGTYTGDEVDVSDLVRDQIVLAVPITPLCREECRGLCPRCGAELNQGPCDCPDLERPAARPRLV